MRKRMREYKLVRCDAAKKRSRTGVRCALAGALSLVLVVTAVPAFVFSGQSKVVAAKESVSGGDVTANDISLRDVSANCMSEEEIHTTVAEVEKTATESMLTREEILIALDAGHGGEDEGTVRDGVLEKDVNYAIIKAVEQKLTTLGYQVLLIREGDELMSIQQRARIANASGAHIYVSVHQNACEERESDVEGVEVWYNKSKGADGSKRLAQLIQSDVVLYTKAVERELVEDESLYVIRETSMPACLVETGFLSNKKERELLVTSEYQEKIAEGIVSGIDLYFFPKTMYLTFDDGPSAENTMAVLDILQKRDVKATFFLIGENVEKHPEVAKRIVEEGHTIGIHCYNHDYDTLYESVASYVADFEKAKAVIYETTGVETKLFRFPGGSVNAYNKTVRQDIIDEMTGKGYIYFDWNASLEDASRDNATEKLLQNACESTLGRRRVVMLAHDVVYNTTLCLEELLEQFPEYKMLPLSEEVEPIHF